ncbi:MAG: class I mannose-6-phosphate isomerase [Dysgonamonadaceae bacterium]|jgi:mannose-6-phosphate isomerase|nr:class I mannose-6-phosphate isomerase [Dysgonamonadaceae bacterium]
MLYPLKFEPVLKPVIWGGDEICAFKNLPPQSGIGESWEISGVKDNVSIVANGSLAGQSLEDLLNRSGEKLLGKQVFERFGTNFPLLIKFIDAKEPLSIQVHPNDELAQRRHQCCGKTEMWYVIHAADNAFLYSGFSRKITPEEYKQSILDDTFMSYLQKYEVRAGDVFFLPAGRVHAIGAGCFIAEIQQTSNITYRIYDYNRKDAQGNSRELHTELALEAIDFQVNPKEKNNPAKQEKICNLAECAYFTTHKIEALKGETISREQNDTFVIYLCIKGKLTLTDKNNFSVSLQQGETVLIPAEIQPVGLQFEEEGVLLESSI